MGEAGEAEDAESILEPIEKELTEVEKKLD